MKVLSIGIIGGADSPTAIFLTSKVSPVLVIGIVAAVIMACMVIIHMRKK